MKKLDAATKYTLYIQAVQSPDTDVLFYKKVYQDFRGKVKKGLTLREDFCGTGILSTEWVKLHPKNKAFGVDLDPEPLFFGHENFISKLPPDQKNRIQLLRKNVLDRGLPQVDIAVAVNFSYFLFRERELLKKYFQNVYRSLKPKGLYIVDIFGGSQCMDAIVDKTRHKNFTYYWDQKNFDPVTNYADFAIHFRYKNKMYEDVFTYDWRLWSIAEIREIMKEAGFKQTQVYWEGTARDGGGNGVFTRITKGEACLSWIAYVVGIK